MPELNFQQLDAALEAGLRDIAPDFANANQDAIESEVYFHPRQTVRKNGDVVGSPRNKVDTGELINSIFGPAFAPDGNSFEIAWEAEHAALVHEGYTTSTGKIVPPARWTEEAMQNFDLLEEYAQSVRQRIGV